MKKFMLVLPIIIVLIMWFVSSKESDIQETQASDIVESENIVESTIQNNIRNSELEIEEKEIQKNKSSTINTPIIQNLRTESVDFATFKPSHNLLVSNALKQEHKISLDFLLDKNNDWSLDFLVWLINQTNAINPEYVKVDIFRNYEEFYEYVAMHPNYYPGNQSCFPEVGDFVLYDNDLDGDLDEISIISYYSDDKITDIAGNRWCEEHTRYEVLSKSQSLQTKNILGIFKPNYNFTRLSDFHDIEKIGLPFNGVDTVVPILEEKYVQILADNGIEVIARYINPEGRTPLSIEEIRLFSKYGIRTMMIYQVNTSDPYKGYDKGYEFGTKALEYAEKLKAPKGMPIFFCCDCNNNFAGFAKVGEFINGVKDAMNGEYTVGLYGGFYTTEALYNSGVLDAYWQCWGFSDRYLSSNYDAIQYTTGRYFFDEIPYQFDANHVKNLEKISFILEDEIWKDSKIAPSAMAKEENFRLEQ